MYKITLGVISSLSLVEAGHVSPRVGDAGNIIKLDARGFNEYFGPIYAG